MARGKFPVMTAVAGASKGKRFTLKKAEYLGGSGKKCSIRLKGDFVAEEHFVLRTREDGNWVVENKSREGTLVNTQRVETKALADGDTIQIGTSNVLMFSVENAPKVAVAESEEEGAAWSPKKIAITAGLGIYLAVMLFAVLHFSQQAGSDAGKQVSIASIDAAVAQTTSYMKSKADTESADTQAAPAGVVDSYMSARYFRILEMQRSNADAGQLEAEYEALENALKERLYAAYKLSAAGQDGKARGMYHQIYDLVPDVRAPVTALALQQADKN